jgi:hypothetical protein
MHHTEHDVLTEHDPRLDEKMRDVYAKWLKEL